MLAQLLIGLVGTWRLVRQSKRIDETWAADDDVRVSEVISVPVSFGSTILFPAEFRTWDNTTRQAAYIHELSHVRRDDFYLLVVAEIHKAIFWFSPFAWWLRGNLAQLAEAISDDAVLAQMEDRPSYAEILVSIAGRTKSVPLGVPMARPATVVRRVERILRETALSVGPSRRILAIVAVIMFLLILVSARLIIGVPESPLAVAVVNAITVKIDDVDATITALGTVTPSQKMTIKPQVSGRLLEVSFQEGQAIKKDDVLAQIDPNLYNIQLEQALARLRQDEARLGRDVDRSALDHDNTIVAYDHAEVDKARRNLASTHIVAPFDGRIGLRFIDPGNYVTPNDQDGIAVITRVTPIDVSFSVAEDDIRPIDERLKAGLALEVSVFDRAGKNRLATGKLVAMDNQIDTNTGTLAFKAEFENADEKLFPGQFVNTVVNFGAIHNAMVLPLQAIHRDGQGLFVWLIRSDSTVTAQAVNIGMNIGNNRVIIVSGLQAGDRIATYESERLQDGSKVFVKDEPRAR